MFRPSNRILLWLAPILFLLVFFFQPLAKIITLAFNASAFTAENFQLILSTLGFTFYQAILSTILTFILGIPSAILFSRFNFHGKSLLRALTDPLHRLDPQAEEEAPEHRRAHRHR